MKFAAALKKPWACRGLMVLLACLTRDGLGMGLNVGVTGRFQSVFLISVRMASSAGGRRFAKLAFKTPFMPPIELSAPGMLIVMLFCGLYWYLS